MPKWIYHGHSMKYISGIIILVINLTLPVGFYSTNTNVCEAPLIINSVFLYIYIYLLHKISTYQVSSTARDGLLPSGLFCKTLNKVTQA